MIDKTTQAILASARLQIATIADKEAELAKIRARLDTAHEQIGALRADLEQRTKDHDTTTGNLLWNIETRKRAEASCEILQSALYEIVNMRSSEHCDSCDNLKRTAMVAIHALKGVDATPQEGAG